MGQMEIQDVGCVVFVVFMQVQCQVISLNFQIKIVFYILIIQIRIWVQLMFFWVQGIWVMVNYFFDNIDKGLCIYCLCGDIGFL